MDSSRLKMDGFIPKPACSPPARWGLLDFMSVACSSPPLLSSSSCSTATLDAQCSLSDLNHDHPRPVFPAGPQPRPSPPSVPCRTSTTTIHAQCSLPDLNREYPRQVFPAGPHVGRYGTKNVQKKVRKNVRQVCYILLANSRVCGRVTGAMPLLTLQVAKFEAISLNRWQSHWGGQRHFHFCTFGAVCKDAWDRQHLTASYYKLLEVISCWIDAWDSQHHTGFLLCITAMVAWWICDIGTFVGASDKSFRQKWCQQAVLKCHGGDHSKQSNFSFEVPWSTLKYPLKRFRRASLSYFSYRIWLFWVHLSDGQMFLSFAARVLRPHVDWSHYSDWQSLPCWDLAAA